MCIEHIPICVSVYVFKWKSILLQFVYLLDSAFVSQQGSALCSLREAKAAPESTSAIPPNKCQLCVFVEKVTTCPIWNISFYAQKCLCISICLNGKCHLQQLLLFKKDWNNFLKYFTPNSRLISMTKKFCIVNYINNFVNTVESIN